MCCWSHDVLVIKKALHNQKKIKRKSQKKNERKKNVETLNDAEDDEATRTANEAQAVANRLISESALI